MVCGVSAVHTTRGAPPVPRHKRGRKVACLVVKPTVCWDILEIIGKSVEVIREEKARALHKRIFAPTFEFLEENGSKYQSHLVDNYSFDTYWEYLEEEYDGWCGVIQYKDWKANWCQGIDVCFPFCKWAPYVS